MATNLKAVRGKMNPEELEMFISMASRKEVEVEVALRDYEIMEYRKIVKKLRSDDYDTLQIATELQDDWEEVAFMIENNRSLNFREMVDFISYITKSLKSELYSLGYSRNWVQDFMKP